MKRIISIVLSLTLVLTLLPATQLSTASAASTIKTVAQLKSAFKNGGTYVVSAHLKVSEKLTVSKNVTLYCNGAGKTISSTCSGDSITVNKGVTLRIGNSTNDTYKLTIRRTSNSSEKAVIKVNEGGFLYLNSGILNSGYYGIYNKGTTTINCGATITNTIHSGVYNYLNATLRMNAGNIKNANTESNINKANYVTKSGIENRGYAIMKAGTISEYGRGIYNSGEFYLHGGSICNNAGSGLFNIGTSEMSGGSIYNNGEDGVTNYKGFGMTGGKIYNNSDAGVDINYISEVPSKYALDQGLGLELSEGTMCEYIMNGTDIVFDEFFGIDGNDITFDWTTTIIEEHEARTYIRDGIIYGNTDGIKISNGYLVISDTTIYSNSQHGINLFSGHVLVNKSTIRNNKGSGIYALANISGSSLELTNTNVYSNSKYGIYSCTQLDINGGSSHDNGYSGAYINAGKAYLSGAFYNNGGYGVYTKSSSLIKSLSNYTMFGNAKSNINF